MGLSDRIARLEARLRPAPELGVPVTFANPWPEISGYDDPVEFWCCTDGRRWDRLPDESDEVFMARARTEALSGYKGPPAVAGIKLTALGPTLTSEQWMERYSPSASAPKRDALGHGELSLTPTASSCQRPKD
jgi:hypothetical protein